MYLISSSSLSLCLSLSLSLSLSSCQIDEFQENSNASVLLPKNFSDAELSEIDDPHDRQRGLSRGAEFRSKSEEIFESSNV